MKSYHSIIIAAICVAAFFVQCNVKIGPEESKAQETRPIYLESSDADLGFSVTLTDDGKLILDYSEQSDIYLLLTNPPQRPKVHWYRNIYAVKDGKIVLSQRLHRVPIVKRVMKEVDEIEYEWEK